MPLSPTTAGVIGAVAGAAAGAAIAIGATTALSTGGPYNTFRSTIKTQSKPIKDCVITPTNQPTHMYRITLTNRPFTVEGLTTSITEMDLLNGVPGPASPYTGSTNWTPTTPLDLDLGLVATPGGGKHARVLIQVVVDDVNVKMIADPFTIISNDANKDMFCRYPGGATTPNSVTFGVNYLPGQSGAKVYGAYSIGVMIPMTSGGFLPIYLDPEMENNG